MKTNPEHEGATRCWDILRRGLLLFTGLFLVLSALLSRPLILWLLDLRALAPWLESFVAGGVGIGAVASAIRSGGVHVGRSWERGLLWLGCLVATCNLLAVMRAGRSEVSLSCFPPVSLLVAALFAWGALRIADRPGPGEVSRRRDWAWIGGVALAAALVFPVVQGFALGWSDYRRPAAVGVVFGARTYADGTMSEALAARVRTACLLHREGRIRRLVFSGGPGDGAVHETEAMRRMAVSLGVPDEDIEVDTLGWNTRKTVEFVKCRHASTAGVVAVSEFYHLPRIRLAFQQAGMQVTTVPARPGIAARLLPVPSLCRETIAFWAYLFRGVRTHSPEIPC